MIVGLAIAMFSVTAFAAIIRVVRGPHLADRVIALDVALVALMAAIATHAAETRSTTYLSIVAVVAIVGFTATVALARFIVAEQEDSNIGRPRKPRAIVPRTEEEAP
jgi:multicomponent Na+:H+ antiporter subunit F